MSFDDEWKRRNDLLRRQEEEAERQRRKAESDRFAQEEHEKMQEAYRRGARAHENYSRANSSPVNTNGPGSTILAILSILFVSIILIGITAYVYEPFGSFMAWLTDPLWIYITEIIVESRN